MVSFLRRYLFFAIFWSLWLLAAIFHTVWRGQVIYSIRLDILYQATSGRRKIEKSRWISPLRWNGKKKGLKQKRENQNLFQIIKTWKNFRPYGDKKYWRCRLRTKMIYWINKTGYVRDGSNLYESYEQLNCQKSLAGTATGIGSQLSEISPSYTPWVTQLKYFSPLPSSLTSFKQSNIQK